MKKYINDFYKKSVNKTHLQKIESRIYKGMRDASAAVALNENGFIVACDEDNDF